MTTEKIIEENISNLVEYQFPEFFRTDGAVFVKFVKEYYKWLESKYYHSKKLTKGTVSVATESVIVTNNKVLGDTTLFKDHFVAGDRIAIYEEDGDCRIYEIASVDSDVQLTLTSPCHFTNNDAEIGTVEITGNVLYHARRLFEYDDIDDTAEEFIVYFKEKYLKNIQFGTLTNKRELVKHALDIYRSKGTPRSVDMLFRMVFGVGAEFYYPSTDIFKLSDGKWYVPKYLELSLNDNSAQFINKQIVGLTSGATAFAEALIRRTVKGKLIDVLYISSIKGNFITGELINSQDGVLNNSLCPRITGSLTELEVDVAGSSELYKVGDIVDVYSDLGEQGKARVTSVSNITGLVSFTLLNSGYAYTTNASVLVSEKVLALSNVITSNTTTYFSLFEKVYQPMANIEYIGGNNYFTEGDIVETYHANNDLKGAGVVMTTQTTNSTAGSLLVTITSGNLNSSPVRKQGNTITANISVFTDRTASANVIAYSSNMTFLTSNINGSFIQGEEVYQLDAFGTKISNGIINNVVMSVGANGTVYSANVLNSFITGATIYGSLSSANAYLNEVAFNVGVVNISGDFVNHVGNRFYGNNVLTTANVSAIGTGSGATFSLANTLDYSETVVLNTDYLIDYESVALNALSYGFANASVNLSSIMDTGLTSNTFTIGRPTRITNVNKGTNYNIPPFVLVYEPLTLGFAKKEKLALELTENGFYIGEIVTQAAANSRGLVIDSNATHITVENLRFNDANYFASTTNSTSYLVGDESGFSANVISIAENSTSTTFDLMGINLDLTSKVQTSNGAVTGLKVVDSGFGFADDELVTFTKEGLNPGSAISKLITHGTSEGRYKRIGGVTSGSKKIYDGYYYQFYSYEIRSSVMLSQYEEMLKKLLHVTGTKYFGAFQKQTEIGFINSNEPTIITVE